MWCYQKPEYEALLLAELQKQQQSSQFCDTLLKTDGASVPAHSCVLSAISPSISSALSSAPPPPAGWTRVLDFRALGACTLLHMVQLLYSGEMAGEGEREKREAISAAAKLGIHGLVEVAKTDREGGDEGGEHGHAEIGVQTEPQMPEEYEGRRGRWRREVRDGSTLLWKETPSDGEKDSWTQTEELQVNTAPPSHPAASFETIDVAAIQSLGQTDPHLLPPQIPYVPISLVYSLDENQQTHQPSTAPVNSTAAAHTSVAVLAPPYTSTPPSLLPLSSQATPSAADPHSWWSGPQGDARDVAEQWEDERFEHFQGNIPGYINYFLNPEAEEGSRGGRARRRRRRGAGAGGASRAGTGERRARRPRARTAGRGRGGFTQTVDVQEVGVSKLQRTFLQRWGTRASTTGQGGGAAGRKLYLKTRELLKSTKGCPRRRGRGKVWEFNLSGDVMEEGGSSAQRGRRGAAQQFNQEGLPVLRAKPTSVPFSSPPMRFYNLHTLSASSPSIQPSPSPAASSASPFLHTTSLPPPAPPPHEEQPEHIDRLLEEVMMGLNILPNNGAPQSQPPLQPSSLPNSSGETLTQNKQQGRTSGLLEAGPGFHGSTQVVGRGAGSSSSANGEVPLLQQQGGGELNEILDHFLQSFEQHVSSCTARQEVEKSVQTCTEANQLHSVLTTTPHPPRPVRRSQITEQSDEAETRRSQPRTEGTPGNVREPAKRPKKKRKKNEYLFSLERKRVRVKKPVPQSHAKTKIVDEQENKQLQQMPVVKLERSVPLSGRVTLQGHSCQSLPVQSAAQTKTSSSAHDGSSAKSQPVSCGRKAYPIRSRFRKAHITDSTPFLEATLPEICPLSDRKRGRPKKNGLLFSLSVSESSTPPIQPQPEEPQERCEEESTVQLQVEAEGATRRGKKRRAKSEEETSDDATVAKRVCFEQRPQLTSDKCRPNSKSAEPAAAEIEDAIDVETGAGGRLQREERKEESACSEIKLGETGGCVMIEERESSGDEIIDVDGDVENDGRENHITAASPASLLAEELSPGSTGSCDEDKDEDIDVIGGSSPAPVPVIISWYSDGEREEGDEDVDVEKTDYSPPALFSAVSKGELVNRKYQAEVLLH